MKTNINFLLAPLSSMSLYFKAFGASERALECYNKADADLNLSRADVEKQRMNSNIKRQQVMTSVQLLDISVMIVFIQVVIDWQSYLPVHITITSSFCCNDDVLNYLTRFYILDLVVGALDFIHNL